MGQRQRRQEQQRWRRQRQRWQEHRQTQRRQQRSQRQRRQDQEQEQRRRHEHRQRQQLCSDGGRRGRERRMQSSDGRAPAVTGWYGVKIRHPIQHLRRHGFFLERREGRGQRGQKAEGRGERAASKEKD